jgi:hypothetical protein
MAETKNEPLYILCFYFFVTVMAALDRSSAREVVPVPTGSESSKVADHDES